MNVEQWLKRYENAFWDVRKTMSGKEKGDGNPSLEYSALYGNTASTLVTNAMQAEQAEKSYQRSLPVNQVSNMMTAGMSRAGALNAINGGGSYTPATYIAPSPGSDAQNVKASKRDLAETILGGMSSVAQVFNSIAERKQQMKLAQMNLKQQDKHFNQTLELERDKFQETANQNAALRNVWQDKSEYRDVQKRALEIQNEINEALKQGTIDKGKAENLAAVARAQLDEVRAKLTKGGYDSLSENQVKSLIEYQVALEIMANFGDMTTTKIISYLHDIIDSLPLM